MQHPFDRRRKNNIATRKRYAERKNDQEFRLTQAFNKRRAISAAQGIPFDIERSDLVYTGICPVLGIEIYYGGPHETTPSIDKIIPSLGYIKGNVRVISQRANRLKSDMSFEECKKLLDNFYKV